jgi:hypothetical protein
MHPLAAAISEAGISQQELSEMVADLRRVRPNGSPLLLAQSTISQICSFRRRTSPEVAEAIVAALKGRVRLTAAELVFAKKPSKKRAA